MTDADRPLLLPLAAEQVASFLGSLPGVRGVRVHEVERIGAGASAETCGVRVSWEQDGRTLERRVISRRGGVRRTEFQVLSALQPTAVPVPPLLGFDDGTHCGQQTIFMERIDGTVTPAFGPPSTDPLVRERLGRDLADIAARIHRLDWEAAGLAFLGRADPETHAAGAINQLEMMLAITKVEPLPMVREAIAWLRRHAPRPPVVALVHGDYRLGNAIWDAARIVAVLDWEMAHIGDPVQDIAWVTLPFWEVDGLVQGLVPRDDLVRLYEQAVGWSVDEDALRFWEVWGSVRMIAIGCALTKAFCDGQVQSLVAAGFARTIPLLLSHVGERIGI